MAMASDTDDSGGEGSESPKLKSEPPPVQPLMATTTLVAFRYELGNNSFEYTERDGVRLKALIF